MANSVTKHTIMNGTRNLIIQVNMAADGTGDESNLKLLDLNDYVVDPEPVPAVNDFNIMKVTGRQGTGTSFQLEFGSTLENNRLFLDSGNTLDDFCQDYSKEGGLPSLVSDTDLTIRITTGGFDASGDTITLCFWIKKKRS